MKELRIPMVINAGLSKEKALLVANTMNELLSGPVSSVAVLCTLIDMANGLGAQMLSREKLEAVHKASLDNIYGRTGAPRVHRATPRPPRRRQ